MVGGKKKGRTATAWLKRRAARRKRARTEAKLGARPMQRRGDKIRLWRLSPREERAPGTWRKERKMGSREPKHRRDGDGDGDRDGDELLSWVSYGGGKKKKEERRKGGYHWEAFKREEESRLKTREGMDFARRLERGWVRRALVELEATWKDLF